MGRGHGRNYARAPVAVVDRRSAFAKTDGASPEHEGLPPRRTIFGAVTWSTVALVLAALGVANFAAALYLVYERLRGRRLMRIGEPTGVPARPCPRGSRPRPRPRRPTGPPSYAPPPLPGETLVPSGRDLGTPSDENGGTLG